MELTDERERSAVGNAMMVRIAAERCDVLALDCSSSLVAVQEKSQSRRSWAAEPR